MTLDSKILVTGGTGFLGSYICRQLWAEGYRNIHSTCRKSSSMDLVEKLNAEITWHEIDLLDVSAVKDLLNDIDVVVHVAGFVSHLQKDFTKLVETNSKLTTILADAANQSGIEMFLHISSIAALGRNAKKEKIDENIIWRKSKFNSGYAISKYLGEMEVWRAHAEGLPVNVINPSIILGAGKWGGGSLSIFSEVYNKLLAYPIGSTGWVDVRDVAKMTVKCLKSEIVGERFICSGENRSFKDVIQMIATEMGVKFPSIKVTPFIAEVAWRAFGVLSFITRKSAVVNKTTARMSQYSYFYQNEKGVKMLDYEYIPLEETITSSAQAFLKSKLEKTDFGVLPLKSLQ